MRTLLSVMSLCVVMGGSAWGDSPSPPTAAGASSATPATSAPAATAPAQPPAEDAELKRMRSLGYTAETRGGVRLYCKNEAQLGTRFTHKTCGNAADIARATRVSKDALGDVQRRSSSQPTGH